MAGIPLAVPRHNVAKVLFNCSGDSEYANNLLGVELHFFFFTALDVMQRIRCDRQQTLQVFYLFIIHLLKRADPYRTSILPIYGLDGRQGKRHASRGASSVR